MEKWTPITEARTEEAKKIRKEMMKQGKDWCPRRGKKLVPKEEKVMGSLTAGLTKENLLMENASDYQGMGVHDPNVGEGMRIYNPKGKSPPLKWRHPVQIMENALDSSSFSQESEASESESKEQFQTPNASLQANGTNTALKFITRTLKQTSNQRTLEKFGVKTSQDMTCSVGDFLAKHLASLGSDEALKILVELYSTRYAELSNITDLKLYSLKMLKDYYLTITGEHLPSFSPRWMTWGMMSNGKCLTLNISEFHRTEKESSLSDILEENVPEKYFLSDKQQERFKEYMEQNQDG